MIKTLALILTIPIATLSVSWAQHTLIYNSPQKNLKIGNYLRFYEDKNHTLDCHGLQLIPDSLFQKSNQAAPNFGISRSKFWLKINLENKTQESLFLLCDEENIFDLELYCIDNTDSVSYARTGFAEPYFTRFFENNQLILPLGQNPKTLYIGISGNATLLASLYIAAQQPLLAWLHVNDTVEGVFLGWMLLVFPYNLFIYFQLRDSIYLYYCLYVISCTFLVIRLEGIGFDLFWRDSPAFNRWIDIPGIINTLVVVFFATQFLQTKAILPTLHRVLQGFMGMVAGLSVLEILDIRPLSNNLVMVAFLVGGILLFWTALAAFRRGFRQARFYLLGWSVFILGTFIITLWKMGIITSNHFLVYNGFLISVMSEAALFSFALADRIRIYRREADDARALSLQRLEENEQLLLKHNQVLKENLRLEQEGQKQPDFREFSQQMDKERSQIKRLSVPSMEGVLLLPVTDIIRIQALGSYCTIHLSHHKKVMASKPLADFEPYLTDNDFLRVHKSHLINLHQVERYIKGDGGMVVMADGSEVSVSRTGKLALLNRLPIK